MEKSLEQLFNLEGKTAMITGAKGFLGKTFADSLSELGAIVIMTDMSYKPDEDTHADYINQEYMDVTNINSIKRVVDSYDKIDILINAAAKDVKVAKDGGDLSPQTRFENMSEDYFNDGTDAMIRGTFLCSQVVGRKMVHNGGGVILNISSELSVISPDQRIYENSNLLEDEQNVKPITYSVGKYSVVAMTKYLATYWAKKNIRVNSLSPSGIYNNHPEDFVKKLTDRIPLGRMMNKEELKGIVAYLCSDASSYMTGQNIILDGGRSVW